MRIGLVTPEIKAEKLAAAVLADTSKKVENVQAPRTQQLNWWESLSNCTN